MRKWRWELLSLGALIGILLIHWCLIIPLIPAIYHDEAPSWALELINFAYPRFSVAKHRFPETFFLEKANQLIFRLSFCVLCVISYQLLLKKNEAFSNWQTQFWNAKVKYSEVYMIPMLYFCLLYTSPSPRDA